MLLLTTPDYLPRIGGLTSLALNVEKVFKEMGIEYELFHWNNYQEIMSFPKEKLKKYDFIMNVHSGFHMYMPESHPRVINFVAGAEILFYSPNFLKHFIKQLGKKKSLRRVEEAIYNIFISDFTFKTMIGKGLKADYSRDLVFHMVVDLKGHQDIPKNWNDNPLRFICVARDVPHKNFAGAIRLCEKVRELSGRPVEFITVTDKAFTSSKIKIISHINPSNEERDKLLAKAHINLLLSLDNSQKGFFEGFGQIVQEAGMFTTPSVVLKTGGLPESVHHNETGWVLPDLEDETIISWWKTMNAESYRRISEQCYHHTLESHGLHNWKKLFETIINK